MSGRCTDCGDADKDKIRIWAAPIPADHIERFGISATARAAANLIFEVFEKPEAEIYDIQFKESRIWILAKARADGVLPTYYWIPIDNVVCQSTASKLRSKWRNEFFYINSRVKKRDHYVIIDIELVKDKSVHC